MSKIVTAATVLTMALSVRVASAQDAAWDKAGITPLAPESRSTPMQAPVGHRQPRLSDLPAPPPDDAKAAVRSRDDTNDRLRICRGC